MPPQPGTPVPQIFVTSGADKRAAGPFQMFAFRDDGTDTDTAIGAASTVGAVTTYLPAVSLFARFYDQGTPDANCGYTTEAVFRGTVQPAAAFECSVDLGRTVLHAAIGRVFFAGTRLSLPNTRFAPITPLACGSGVYPCRSQFDSIIYALGAETGLAAYDLNAAGDDAYRIFRDSRIAAITVQADPDPGAWRQQLHAGRGSDEGRAQAASAAGRAADGDDAPPPTCGWRGSPASRRRRSGTARRSASRRPRDGLERARSERTGLVLLRGCDTWSRLAAGCVLKSGPRGATRELRYVLGGLTSPPGPPLWLVGSMALHGRT